MKHKIGDTIYFRGDRGEILNITQAEKVEVPSCMSIFLDHYPDKAETSMHIVMHDFTESEYFSEFAKIPLANYPMGWDRLMASALMFGYTVEQPKRWVVKKGRDCILTSFTLFRGDLVNYDANSRGKDYIYFTDLKKAEAVATLVDGSVEEV